MEHAPLRPVPARPAGPIDAATALREVGSWLPALEPDAMRALALVVLAERPRAAVARALGVSEEEVAKLLAAARKELRQTVVTLGGSGWCERAETLISDRLDGALAGRDVRRLGGRPAPASPAPVPLVEAAAGDVVEGALAPAANDGIEQEPVATAVGP